MNNDSEHEKAISGDDPLIPPIGVLPSTVRLFRINWISALERSPSGAPVLSPEFVAAQGRAVRLIDVRDEAELNGPLGHIPGSDWVPLSDVDSIAARVHRDEPLIFIARTDERSKRAAEVLASKGLRMVAAMSGGLVAWKALGFATSREARIAHRRGELRTIEAPAEEPSRHLTLDDVKHHIGDAFAVRHMKFASMLLHGRLSCVDGRDDSGVVGTPGGDAGEFLLALSALERVTGRPLDDVVVTKLLRRRLDTFGRFYLHSDVHGGNALIAALRADRRLDPLLDSISHTHEWRRLMQEPPKAYRSILLDIFMNNPQALGCGHVRMSWQQAEVYGTRPLLIESFLRMFFTLRWNGAVEAEYVTLGGGHREGAVLNVVVDGGVHSFTTLPLVSPSTGKQQMFVNHPQVSGFLRNELVEFIAQQDDIISLTRGQHEALRTDIAVLGQQQLMATLQRLAAGLPIYQVRFGRNDDVGVEAQGHVPLLA